MPASTVTEYLAALPADRRDALNEVRRGINPGYDGTPALTNCHTLQSVDMTPRHIGFWGR